MINGVPVIGEGPKMGHGPGTMDYDLLAKWADAVLDEVLPQRSPGMNTGIPDSSLPSLEDIVSVEYIVSAVESTDWFKESKKWSKGLVSLVESQRSEREKNTFYGRMEQFANEWMPKSITGFSGLEKKIDLNYDQLGSYFNSVMPQLSPARDSVGSAFTYEPPEMGLDYDMNPLPETFDVEIKSRGFLGEKRYDITSDWIKPIEPLIQPIDPVIFPNLTGTKYDFSFKMDLSKDKYSYIPSLPEIMEKISYKSSFGFGSKEKKSFELDTESFIPKIPEYVVSSLKKDSFVSPMTVILGENVKSYLNRPIQEKVKSYFERITESKPKTYSYEPPAIPSLPKFDSFRFMKESEEKFESFKMPDLSGLKNLGSFGKIDETPLIKDIKSKPFESFGNYIKDIGLMNIENDSGVRERFDFGGNRKGTSGPHFQYDLLVKGEPLGSNRKPRPLGAGTERIDLGSSQRQFGYEIVKTNDPDKPKKIKYLSFGRGE